MSIQRWWLVTLFILLPRKAARVQTIYSKEQISKCRATSQVFVYKSIQDNLPKSRIGGLAGKLATARQKQHQLRLPPLYMYFYAYVFFLIQRSQYNTLVYWTSMPKNFGFSLFLLPVDTGT